MAEQFRSTDDDDERACFRAMGHAGSAAIGRAKRIRKRRYVDVKPRMNSVIENIGRITSQAREALSGSWHHRMPMHVATFPSGNVAAALHAVINYSFLSKTSIRSIPWLIHPQKEVQADRSMAENALGHHRIRIRSIFSPSHFNHVITAAT